MTGHSRSIARELQPGDEVVVTRLDHDANVSPWVLAARIAHSVGACCFVDAAHFAPHGAMHYNTRSEVERLVDVLGAVCRGAA